MPRVGSKYIKKDNTESDYSTKKYGGNYQVETLDMQNYPILFDINGVPVKMVDSTKTKR